MGGGLGGDMGAGGMWARRERRAGRVEKRWGS